MHRARSSTAWPVSVAGLTPSASKSTHPSTHPGSMAPSKRKAEAEVVTEDGSQPSSKKQATGASELVNAKRVRELKKGKPGNGPVIYWMTRDQRMNDNWALLYALEQAAKTQAPVAVVLNLVREWPTPPS